MQKQTNNLLVIPTNVDPHVQIGEIIEIIPASRPSRRNGQRKNADQRQSTHFIESDFFAYPSTTLSEDQVTLDEFFVVIGPILCIAIFLFFPLPAFAGDQIKQRVKVNPRELNEIGKANGFRVRYPSKVLEEMASEAFKTKSVGKKIGRRLVEKVQKISPLFNFKPNFQAFQDKELFLTVGEPIIEKIVTINGNKTIPNTIERSYLFLFSPAIAILQSFDSEFSEKTILTLEKIRGGAVPTLLGWFGQAWGFKKNVEQVIDVVRGKKQPKNETNWTDFFPTENSNTNKSDKNKFGSVISQITTSSGSIIAIWYFLALYNKSRREGSKLPVPEFILPDLVPEVRRVSFKEKLYNFAIKLIDLSTPTPYAIILLATFIYFFVYAGKGNSSVNNAFSFVNTLFQQLVKATEKTQEYLTEEIKRTNLEAKVAQNELKEEHRLQHEKLAKEHLRATDELNLCRNDIGESAMVNQYSSQVNHQLRSHLQTCERRLAVGEEILSITSEKISTFKGIIKNDDGSFNEHKFDILAAEVKDIVTNDVMNPRVLQKAHSRSEDRLFNIDRNLPPFPIQKVVEFKTPANKFIDGILNVFGIQTKPTQTAIVRRSPTIITTTHEHFTEHGNNNNNNQNTQKDESGLGGEIEGKQEKTEDLTMMQFGGH